MIKEWTEIEASIDPALVEAGYARLQEGIYRAVWSTTEVEHLLYVFPDYKWKDLLTGDFGVKNRIAENFSCNAIRTYGGELFKTFRCGESDSCTMRFSFGMLEPSAWPIRFSAIPHSELGRSELGGHFRNFIRERLVPAVGHVTTLRHFFSLLTGDAACFPWIRTNGAIRAAQIVALAGQIGLDADHVRSVLEVYKPLIARGLPRISEMRADPAGYINRILEDWAVSSN
jgi:hypothetical protein